jgi:hypothetical protein
MTCDACDRARADRLSGLYSRGCPECDARALAHAPAFHTAAASNTITPDYRNALRSIMQPGESIDAAHKRVRAWDKHIRSIE